MLTLTHQVNQVKFKSSLNMSNYNHCKNKKNTKQKCQPAAGDMPDLIQTEHVPSRGLTRPKKYTKHENNKMKIRMDSTNVTLVGTHKLTKLTSVPPNTKTKKCQPAAGDMPDLIQTEHVPSRGLTRPKKNTKHENNKKKIHMKSNDVTLVKEHELTQSKIKTIKCQPVVGDMPDLIQTVHVPSNGLARQQKKINRTKKLKCKNKSHSNDVTLVRTDKYTISNTKTKKCQPVAGDMPDLIQTEHVPSKGLARQKKI